MKATLLPAVLSTCVGVLLTGLTPSPLAAQVSVPSVVTDARQLLLVVTPGWDDRIGELRRFTREVAGGAWTPVGEAAAIVVGRNGTAWDPLTTPVVPGPTKREGDGRAPAGAFSLGTAFGFAPPADAAWLKVPYLPVTEGTECVDDGRSSVYNQIVDRRRIETPDWSSSEKMRAIGDPYRWGVVVNYNTPAVSGRGSCIFLHIGGSGGQGTAGCTAMTEAHLREVMAWLDPAQAPVLVQLPRPAHEALRQPWRLP